MRELGEAGEPGEPGERSLENLGWAQTPSLDPLCYPGKPLDFAALLSGDDLWPVTPADTAVAAWAVEIGRGIPLDDALAERGAAPMRHRVPVLAIGSHGAPGQLRYKLRDTGLSTAVPMIPVRVHGIRIGFSAHVSPAGYVAASPYVRPGAVCDLIVTWLDPLQLKAVDDTEYPEYRRVVLPAPFAVELPSGARLPDAHIYVNALGVLSFPDGAAPTAAMPQPDILTALCAQSAALRGRFGASPEEFVRRARASPDLRAFGTRVLAESGWLLRQPQFDALPDARGVEHVL